MTTRNDRDQDAQAGQGGPRHRSRRDFLQLSAAAAGVSLLPSCFMDSADTAPPVEATPEFLPNIKNIVVVMFENRSFDNLLGYLYSDGSAQAGWPAGLTPPPVVPAPQSFDGLWKFLDHPLPCSGLKGCNLDSAGNPVWAYPYPTPAAELDWRHPYPNAEEGYANYERHQFEHDMGGFATDYEKRFPLPAPAPSPPLVPAQSVPSPTMIMGSYPPSQLPVLSTLARNFAVFDHWFCAVPSETYCNRSFFHAATSSGYLYNAPQEVDKANGIATQTAKWKNNSSLTILERLSEASTPVSWKVYYEPAQDNELKRGLTALIHPQAFSKYPDRFVGVDFAKPVRQRVLYGRRDRRAASVHVHRAALCIGERLRAAIAGRQSRARFPRRPGCSLRGRGATTGLRGNSRDQRVGHARLHAGYVAAGRVRRTWRHL